MATLRIFKETITEESMQVDMWVKISKQVVETIHDKEIILDLIEEGRKDWCLEGDGGVVFETTGLTIKEVINPLQLDMSNLLDDEIYHCTVSF